MKRRSLLLLLPVLACGSPAAPLQAHAPTKGPLSRARQASTRALPGYPPLAEPGPPACVLTGSWPFDQPRELRFRRGGRTFATMNHIERAALSLGEDPASPFVELTAPHLRLWGTLVADQLLLHPAHPLLIDGYLAPGPTAVFHWVGAQHEPVPVVLDVPSFVKPAAPPRDDLRCRDLATAPAEFEPSAAIDAPEGQEMMLAEGKRIPISREPNGSAAADLEFEEAGSPIVEVIERRGDRARIVVQPSSMDPAEDVLVVGWVAAAALVPHNHGFGGSWGNPGDGAGAMQRPHEGWKMVTCSHEVPLVVELEGEQHLVGAVAAGTRLEVPPDAGTAVHRLVDIAVRSRQVEFAEGVRVLAKGSAVADCSPALAPEQ